MAQLFFRQPDWQLFTNINTLPQQAGVSKHLLPKLIAKELTDNALDTGAKVEVAHENDGMFEDTIIIRDYGEGFTGSNEEIADLFSINRPLTSSKRFRLPMRGALGNGLRVVAGVVYCTGGKLQISTQGRVLELHPQDDGRTSFTETGTYNQPGTEIRISIPDNFFGEDILAWAERALQLNQGEVYEGKTNAYWYDSDSFYNLLRTVPEEVPLLDFLVFFDKITPAKAKKIGQTLPADVKINALSREQTEEILAALRRLSKPIAPKKLGFAGRLEEFPAYHKELTTLILQTTKGQFEAQIPVVIEAFAQEEGDKKMQCFVNKTPITGEVDMTYYEKKLTVYGCGLYQTMDIPKLENAPTVWVNILTPYMPIVSNGKEPDLSVLREPIAQALLKVARQLKKSNSPAPATSTPLVKPPSQKKVVIGNIHKAIEKASGNGQYRYSLRQLYYVMRPFVMEYTGKELKYANFNTIITDYEHAQGKDLEGVYRDERGTLLHPHTHEEIRLGTKSVEKYRRPVFNFNKILYSEKEGFFEILKEAGFCEKHDCALLTSKGFASRAARDVIDLLAETEEELLFFCIHDADISGTLIYQALQGATRARPGRKVKIINLGLEPWEGLAMQLEVESLERKSAKTPAQYVLEFDEDITRQKPFNFEKFARWAAWEEWLKSYRIELNAMDTPTFIHWLDQKVSQYDNGKVIPHETYLRQEAESSLEAGLRQKIKTVILEKLSIDALVTEEFEKTFPAMKAAMEEIPLEKNVKEQLDNAPQQSWKQGFLAILQELLKE